MNSPTSEQASVAALESGLRAFGREVTLQTEYVPERDAEGKSLGVEGGGFTAQFWRGGRSLVIRADTLPGLFEKLGEEMRKGG